MSELINLPKKALSFKPAVHTDIKGKNGKTQISPKGFL